MTYSRNIYTFDNFDYPISNPLQICIIGTETNCGTFNIKTNDPVMTVSSALTIGEKYIEIYISLATMLYIIMI